MDFTTSLDKKFDEVEEKIIIAVYSVLIVLGVFGNLLVIWTVLFNKHMRTSNNFFILNLAISDLILCVFSIPFNAYKSLRHTWVFGNFLCGLAPFFQASNAFVSSMSITAIALDRFVNIVCAMKIRQTNSLIRSYGVIAILVFIWLFAFFLSYPLFKYSSITTSTLDPYSNGLIHIQHDIIKPSMNSEQRVTEALLVYNDSLVYVESEMPFEEDELTSRGKRSIKDTEIQDLINTQMNLIVNSTESSILMPFNETNIFNEELGIDLSNYRIYHCVERWNINRSRIIYAYCTLLIQYILPFLVVGIAYGSIWWKLKKHRDKLKSHANDSSSNNNNNNNNARNKLFKKKNKNNKMNKNEFVVIEEIKFNKNQPNQQASPKLNKNNPSANNLSANRNNPNGTESTVTTNVTPNRKNLNSSTQETKRQRKMNLLLSFIAIIFGISWMPLHIFNILSDSELSIVKPGYTYYLINTICILLGMSSAVSNPSLYGVFNENFKREYVKLFNNIISKLLICFGKNSSSSPRIETEMNGNSLFARITKPKCANNNLTNVDCNKRLLKPNNSPAFNFKHETKNSTLIIPNQLV